jgi:hypothetical protein
MSSIDLISELCKESFERFPFAIILAKRAPENLDHLHYDKDFCYVYFSPSLETRCSLKRSDMLTGSVNAKSKFAPDYERIFADDVETMKVYTNHKVKYFCEHWAAPNITGAVPYVYAMKTAFTVDKDSFMLCITELIDELMLGNCMEKEIGYNAVSDIPPMMMDSRFEQGSNPPQPIPNSWFRAAFDHLPYGMMIYNKQTGEEMNANHCYYSQKEFYESDIEKVKNNNENTDLLTIAKWSTTIDGNMNVGIYSIQLKNRSDESQEEEWARNVDTVFIVLVLRPAMLSTADPYFREGRLRYRK